MHLSLKSSLGRQYLDNSMGDKLLSEYGGAAAAYSLRSLTGNGGNVVNVRRSSDNAEQAFTAQEVSDGTLVDFCAPSEVQDLYNQRMYFDGVNDVVIFDALTLSNSDISINFYYSAAGQYQFMQWVDNANTNKGLAVTLNSTNGGTAAVAVSTYNISDDSHNQSLSLSSIDVGMHTLSISTNSSGVIESATVDGVLLSAGGAKSRWEVSPYSSGNNKIRIGNARNTFVYSGILSNFLVNDTFSTQGYGNTNADWEDQVGSNDGTVSGSPALFNGQGFDGFVETGYDQSGNGRHATQTTAASQPKIVDGGVLVTGGIDFDGVDDFFLLDSALTATNSDYSVFSVSNYGTASNGHLLSLERTNSDFLFIYANRDGGAIAGTAVGGGVEGTAFPEGSKSLKTILLKDSDAETFIDGSNVDDNMPFTQRDSGTVALGARVSGVQAMLGSLKEIVIYDSDQSANRAAIEANLADQYGITLA